MKSQAPRLIPQYQSNGNGQFTYVAPGVFHTEGLPFPPLEQAIRKRLWADKWGMGNNVGGLAPNLPNRLRQAYYRGKKVGHVTVRQGDEFAHALGLHPSEIWDEW